MYDNVLYHTFKRTMIAMPETASTPPQRRPVIRAVSFDEAGAAIGRLLPIALPPTRAANHFYWLWHYKRLGRPFF